MHSFARTQAVIMPQNGPKQVRSGLFRARNFALRKPLLCRKIGAKTQRGAHAKPPKNSKTTQPHTEPPTKPRAQP
ncbi:hypothetical protein ACRALDRAFT_213896 [Sodiomyces alcalophilus JCM 7366]|uniref:uncharacterized protein n=1 Tax=Sodiomyces alcalophilus JCM 7366 TaxID=591952 RepID=UPI0039B6945C